MPSRNKTASASNPPGTDLPKKLAQPAQRALAAAGIRHLEQLTKFSEAEIKELHGIGPNALIQLRNALQAKGLSFAGDKFPKMSPRTLSHHFKQATGLSRKYIRQMKHAQQATALLKQGASILDTVYKLGYFDQPHMTRAF